MVLITPVVAENGPPATSACASRGCPAAAHFSARSAHADGQGMPGIPGIVRADPSNAVRVLYRHRLLRISLADLTVETVTEVASIILWSVRRVFGVRLLQRRTPLPTSD